jgi:mRNA interferase MazF
VIVVQSDRFNRSAIQTAVVASVTSNLRLGRAAGNVSMHRGEAGLPRASVVNVSQLRTIDRDELHERIGTLSPERLREVRQGLALLLETESA